MRLQLFASIAAGTLLAVLLLMPRTIAAQNGGAAPAAPPARGAAPPAGRGAPPPPAVTTPYVRPVSKYVPPKTPDGQPNISGLYLAIPLPRNIETPLAPGPARGGGADAESASIPA